MTELPIPIDEAYKIVRKALTKHKAHVRTLTEFEDLVQLTMIKTLEVLDSYNEKKGSFSNFLYMQANWVLWRQDLHEKSKGRRKFLTSFSLDREITYMDRPIPLVDTIVEEEKTDDDWKLEILMENLEPNEWFLLTEWLLKKKSGRIIALELGIKETTIHSRLKQLKKKARKIIDENIIR